MRSTARASHGVRALVALTLAAIMGVAWPSPAQAYSTAAIADNAETHADLSYGGQCKAFVGNVVQAVTGAYPSGYQQGFANAGAAEIANPASAVRGDIIQITPAGSTDATAESLHNPSMSSRKLHTAVIRAPRNGDGTFNVIDSNWNNDQLVRRHSFNPYSWAAGSIIKIWRFGASPGPAPDATIVRIKRSTFGSSQQVYSATKTQVFESWWTGGSGVSTNLAATVPAGEEIVDIDKITQTDGVTQSIYTATKTGVYETWWNGNGFSNAAKIVNLSNVRRVVADLKIENGTPTHRLYVLAADGPYEFWWKDGGPVSNGYRLWNINLGHSILKTVAYDGRDEIYVGTPTNVYRMKWPVNGGIERVTVTQLADTVDIQKQTKPDGTELLYTVTKTGVHETWWRPGTGFSNPAKIVTINNGENVITAVKTTNGVYDQLYVATTGRVIEYWWQPGGTINSGQLIHISQNNIVDIEKVSTGSYQNLYTAHQDVVWETWWGGGSHGTSVIVDLTP
jgi:hypothetical protein